MSARVVVAGGGVGGIGVANHLARRLPPGVAEVHLVDRSGRIGYPPALLGGAVARMALPRSRPIGPLLRPGVQLAVTELRSLDPTGGRAVLADGRMLGFDWLVIATGTRSLVPSPDPRAACHPVPGGRGPLAADPTTPDGAASLREAFGSLEEGPVLIGSGVPAARYPLGLVELAFGVDARLRARGVRHRCPVVLACPSTRACGGIAADAVEALLVDRDIRLVRDAPVLAVDADRGVVTTGAGTFESAVAALVPPQAVAPFLAGSPLLDASGFVAVEPRTLRSVVADRVFAVGDTTALDVARTAQTATAQSAVVVAQLVASLTGTAADLDLLGAAPPPWFIDTGDGRATVIRPGAATVPAPSRRWHAAKWAANRHHWWLTGAGASGPSGRAPVAAAV